jgi:1,4-dihydroxy-2-naphthoate polyprenyltransferase
MEPERPSFLPLVLRLARAQYAPVILLPIGLGTALSWWATGEFHLSRFLLAFFGAFCAHLGANAVNDVYDFRTGADTEAETRDSRDFGGSDVLTRGWMSDRVALLVAVVLFVLAGTCGVVLVASAGWPVLALGLLGFLLAWFYVAPPIRYGYRGRGMGEVGIFISFGMLPVTGAWFIQTGAFSVVPLVASLPMAFFTTAILFNHHFTHPESDRAVGKISPVVALGVGRSLILSRLIVACVYLSIAAAVCADALPPLSLLGLLTIPLMRQAYEGTAPSAPTEAFMALTSRTAGANILTGLIIIASLLLDGLLLG